ncbi:MAG: LysR substrate-binding domain-containing protein [Breoghania sp.]|nr:LysR substrate-binding domain-containing protein [Breoghania sp.]
MRVGHSLLRKKALSLEDLKSQKIVLLTNGCETVIAPLLEAAGCRAEFVRNHLAMTALNMVREGIGVAIAPRSYLADIDMLDLRCRAFEPMLKWDL